MIFYENVWKSGELSTGWATKWFILNGEWDEWNEEIFGRQITSIKKVIILISPYGSNDLLIRFTHSAVRQLEGKILFNLC